jgi:hypothetical protein
MTRAWKVIAVACALVGCTSKHPTAGGGGTGGSSGTGDDAGVMPGDGGGGMSGSGDAGGQGPEGPYTLRGVVSVVLAPTAGSNISDGNFFQSPAGACSRRIIGPCELSACPNTASTAVTKVSAGAISLGGGAQDLTLVWNAATSKYGLQTAPTNPLNWLPGDMVKVSAAGDAAPAFSDTVVMPQRASFRVPASGATVPRSQDLTVAWGFGSSPPSPVMVQLRADVNVGPILQCTYGADVLTGTIPTEALAALPAGSISYSAFAADLHTLPVTGGYVHVVAAVTDFTGTLTLQ